MIVYKFEEMIKISVYYELSDDEILSMIFSNEIIFTENDIHSLIEYLTLRAMIEGF